MESNVNRSVFSQSLFGLCVWIAFICAIAVTASTNADPEPTTVVVVHHGDITRALGNRITQLSDDVWLIGNDDDDQTDVGIRLSEAQVAILGSSGISYITFSGAAANLAILDANGDNALTVCEKSALRVCGQGNVCWVKATITEPAGGGSIVSCTYACRDGNGNCPPVPTQ